MIQQVERFKEFKKEITRFMMMYKFALSEMETKVDILKEEFQLLHDYNPIEHTSSRLKSPESIMKKIQRKKLKKNINFTNVKNTIKDIAGLRITCSFISDIYRIHDMLTQQRDVKVLEVKDYIESPKPNGYQSMHLLIEIPVFMSDREEHVPVEIQIRTIAMDFWASLEHKIYYKYDADVPNHLLSELKDAAESANSLDKKMERIHNEIKTLKKEQIESETRELNISNQQFTIPEDLLDLINTEKV